MAHILKEKSRQLTNLNGVLIVMSPLAVLDRGYAIVQSSDDKTIIKSKSQVSEGEILNILLAEGRLCTQVLPDSNKKG
jgi:exodeoxyribonuclease VII large subunit